VRRDGHPFGGPQQVLRYLARYTHRVAISNRRLVAWSGELRHICKDGHEVVVDSRMQLLGDDTVLEVNRDVTEIKALMSQQAMLMRDLSAAAVKFAALFDQSGIFAGIVDLQGYLREANNLSLDWCGYTKEQVLDRPFWDTPWWRGSEEMKARIRFATDQAVSGSVFREELRYWVADGSERIVDFAMHPIRDQSGAVIFLHPTGIDITERTQIEVLFGFLSHRLDHHVHPLKCLRAHSGERKIASACQVSNF
jgi:PAS domain S-box-containing protein